VRAFERLGYRGLIQRLTRLAGDQGLLVVEVDLGFLDLREILEDRTDPLRAARRSSHAGDADHVAALPVLGRPTEGQERA